MSLTKEQNIDKVEVLENGTIQVRQATIISENGVQLSKSYHRWSFAPGDDISEQPDNVKAIAEVTWTPAVIDAYKVKLASYRLGQ